MVVTRARSCMAEAHGEKHFGWQGASVGLLPLLRVWEKRAARGRKGWREGRRGRDRERKREGREERGGERKGGGEKRGERERWPCYKVLRSFPEIAVPHDRNMYLYCRCARPKNAASRVSTDDVCQRLAPAGRNAPVSVCGQVGAFQVSFRYGSLIPTLKHRVCSLPHHRSWVCVWLWELGGQPRRGRTWASFPPLGTWGFCLALSTVLSFNSLHYLCVSACIEWMRGSHIISVHHLQNFSICEDHF